MEQTLFYVTGAVTANAAGYLTATLANELAKILTLLAEGKDRERVHLSEFFEAPPVYVITLV